MGKIAKRKSLDESESKILQLNIEEYKLLTEQISKRVDYQQRILNYLIALTGIVLTAGLHFLDVVERSKDDSLLRYFLLLAPFPFYFLSWAFSNQDIMIVAIARYVNLDLRKRICVALGADALKLEEFLHEERRHRVTHFGKLPTLGEDWFFSMIIPLLLVLLYCFAFVNSPKQFTCNELLSIGTVPEFALLIVNTILLAKTFTLRKKSDKYYTTIAPKT